MLNYHYFFLTTHTYAHTHTHTYIYGIETLFYDILSLSVSEILRPYT